MAGEIRFHQPRNPKGQFAAFERDIRDLMLKEATQYQHEVVNYMQANYKRKKDSTGRLASVTLSHNNRIITPSTWRVGNPAFLDRSSAKYWRTIEQGSLAVWSRPFRGTPLMLRPGGFPGGRPFRSFKIGTKATNFRNGRPMSNGSFVVRVTKEIAPMNAYRIVFEENGWQARIQRDFRQSVGRLF